MPPPPPRSKYTTPKDHYLPTCHPPQPPQEYDQFLSGGEGIVHPPLPQIPCKQIYLEELSLIFSTEVDESTKKKNKYD